MGFLGNIFGSNRETISPNDLYDSFYRELLLSSVKVLRSRDWTNVSNEQFPILKDDRGFFNDLMSIFKENVMYMELKNYDPDSYREAISSVAFLGGIYAVFCARIFQKPLYTNYSEVMRRFKQDGPINCVLQFLRNAPGPHQWVSPDTVVYEIVQQIGQGRYSDFLAIPDDAVATDFCKALYHAGNAIGLYYI